MMMLFRRLRRKWLLLLASVLILLVAGLLFAPVRVSGSSMRPILTEGDLLVTLPPWLQEPARNDLVVLEEPETGHTVVKRLVGMPGESVQLVGEDLYVNGEPSMREVRGSESLVPLVDAEGADAARFFNLDDMGFVPRDGAWHLEGTGAASLREPPLDGYLTEGDQWHNKPPRPVADIGVEVAFQLESPDAELHLTIHEDRERFVLRLEEGGTRLRVLREGSHRVELHRTDFPGPVVGGVLFFTNVDQTLVGVLDGELVFETSYGFAEPRPLMEDVPLDTHFSQISVGGRGPITLGRIRVGRDLVRDPSGTHGCGQPLHLGQNEYYVLGDAPTDSRDSRNYGAVTRDRLRGVVVGRVWPPGPPGMGWDR